MTDCPLHGSKWIGPDTIEQKDPIRGTSRRIPNPNARRCYACMKVNEGRGRAKRQPLREVRGVPRGPAKREVGPGYTLTDTSTVQVGDFERFLRRLGDGGNRAVELAAASRRPAGVSKAAYGVAIRKASGEPMLNGDPRRVTDALQRGERSYRHPKAGLIREVIVKPEALAVGKVAGWWERRWTIHRLKYGKGCCIVTDTGDESRTFPTTGECLSAIVKSGWRITR